MEDDGITVESGVTAEIAHDIYTSGDHLWRVQDAATLVMPAWFFADPGATLELQVDGTMEVAGNLNGNEAACVIKTGPGTLNFTNNPGGGVGACGTGPEGLLVQDGVVTVAPGSNIGGKSFALDGGLFSGGSLASPTLVKQLNLLPGGWLSPGEMFGDGLGALELYGPSVWSGGIFTVDLNPVTAESDRVGSGPHHISVDGTTVDLRFDTSAGLPASEVTFVLVESGGGVSGTGFISAAGDVLADGDEFESNGHIYRYGASANQITVTWVREVPPAVAPTFTSGALPNGTVGNDYSFTVSATGDAPISYSATGLPAGLSIDPATGAVTGKPTAAGTFTVAVTASNAGGTVTANHSVKIAPAATTTPAKPKAGEPLAATGGPEPGAPMAAGVGLLALGATALLLARKRRLK